MQLDRWQNFSRHDQLLHIGAEIIRAGTYQGQDQESFLFSIKQALELLELTLKDIKWQEQKHLLLGLHEELQKFVSGERKDNIKTLYQAL